MKRIGVVGIVLKGDKNVAVEMQKVLSEFADIIIGRMGVPREEANAIALIVEGTQERISALTGKLGRFESLSVKSHANVRVHVPRIIVAIHSPRTIVNPVVPVATANERVQATERQCELTATPR